MILGVFFGGGAITDIELHKFSVRGLVQLMLGTCHGV
jgi:hypothetical protein